MAVLKTERLIFCSRCYARDTRWLSCLKHCTTSRKAAGLICGGVIGIFHRLNPCGRTMALGVNSASNKNESQGYWAGWGELKGGRCVGLTALLPSYADSGRLNLLEP